MGAFLTALIAVWRKKKINRKQTHCIRICSGFFSRPEHPWVIVAQEVLSCNKTSSCSFSKKQSCLSALTPLCSQNQSAVEEVRTAESFQKHMSHLKGCNHSLSCLEAAWDNFTPTQAADVSAEPHNCYSPVALALPAVLFNPSCRGNSFMQF